jgi:DNA polymerase I-like protein with 3'-5' exonuclease and polymerase domains
MAIDTALSNKEFILKRIYIYAGGEIDVTSDAQVSDLLKAKFNLSLPQRQTFNESLRTTNSEHEIISLILQYRSTL